MVIAARGSRSSAMLLGMLGALLQITAISQVVTNIDNPLSIGAYALGGGHRGAARVDRGRPPHAGNDRRHDRDSGARAVRRRVLRRDTNEVPS